MPIRTQTKTNKIQYYIELQQKTAHNITRNAEHWRDFLITATNLYKYSFPNQLLLYAQRPEATACAELEIWNKRMNRYIAKGSKGIALVDHSGDNPRLHYVFDVADTVPGRYRSRTPQRWSVTTENTPVITQKMNDRFGINSMNFTEAIPMLAEEIVRDNLDEYVRELMLSSQDSFLEDLDKANITKSFREVVVNSIAFSIYTRCGYDAEEYIPLQELSGICDYNTVYTVAAIGTAVSDMTEEILRQIERSVKEYDLQKRKELQHEQQHREPERTEDREIRSVEKTVSTETQADIVQSADTDRRTDEPSERDTADSSRERAAADRESVEAVPTTVEVERDRVDKAHEHDTDDSGGSLDAGADTDVSPLTRGMQMSLFDEPTEPVKDNINQAAIDAALRQGSGFEKGKFRIYEYYVEQHTIEENAKFLKNEYGTGGSTALLPESNISTWHSSKGIELKRGENSLLLSWNNAAQRIGVLISNNDYLTPAERDRYKVYSMGNVPIEEFLKSGSYDKDSIIEICVEFSKGKSNFSNENFLRNKFKGVKKGLFVNGERVAFSCGENFITYAIGSTTADRYRSELFSWGQAAELVKDMLEAGRFAPLEVLENLHSFELEKAAQGLWYMHHDVDFENYPELIDLFEPEWFNGGFPDSTSRIAEMLDNPETREDFIAVVDELAEMYSEGEDIMRFDLYTPERVQSLLHDLDIDRTRYTAENYTEVAGQYITDDEISAYFRGADRYNEKNMVVYEFFNEHKSASEREQYLHDTYGKDNFPNGSLYARQVKKDIVFTRTGAEQKTFTWSELTKFIGRLVDNNRYLTERQITKDIPEYHRQQEDRRVHNERYEYVWNGNKKSLEERATDLPKRLYYFIETIDLSDRRRFEEFGFSDLINSTEKHVNEVIVDLSSREALLGCLHRIQMGTTDVYARNVARNIQEEINVFQSIEQENEQLSWYSEYAGIKAKYEDEIVMYRVGDFYEMFGSDAEHAAEVLEITLTQRNNGVERITICGIPAFALESYISRLVSHGFGVAVADINGDVHSVTRIIMPGSEEISESEIVVTDSDSNIEEDPAAEEEPEGERSEPDQSTEVAAIAVGMELTVDGREFEIESISGDKVSLIDKTFQNGVGFPIFRIEPIDKVLQWMQSQAEKTPPTEVLNIPIPDNFKITDYELGIGGDKSKFKRNLEAIRTLKTIEAENRYATPEEQEVLSQYVGWGGLAAAFDEQNGNWSNEYMQLKNILTADEYSAARASTLSSFYTSPVIIEAMYTALSNMGFTKGNILEPSCGVGNFFGMLPDIMSDSKLYGVELDSITGRIAQKLYPHADIKIQGFENANMPDNFYDVVIGNVPFGDFKVADQRYNKYNFNIHDYFIAKSLDKVRAGGVVAVVVTKGFMDKANPSVRKYVAQRAELLGAIRLPNNAFKDNAGTEVISDILFFQKRDRMVEIEPEWVFINQNEDNLPVNNYFIEHPEMVLGELKMGINKLYGKEEVICTPIEGASLSEQLSAAVVDINGYIPEVTLDDISEPSAENVSLPADPNVKNFSYTIVDGDVYYRTNSVMNKVELPAATTERVKGMIEIRDCTRRLMDLQLEEYGDDVIRKQQVELNRLYDVFTSKYGLINSMGNRRAFREDADYYLLSSLEVIDEDGELERKADMFTKRTIKQRQNITKVETAVEALAISIGERAKVDLAYMQELTGFERDKIISDLEGVIYPNPETIDENNNFVYESSDEYLSGNIRHKLRYAEMMASQHPELAANVTALREVMPKELEAGDIDVRLGATWVKPEYIQQFMYEQFETPWRHKRDMKVNYSPHTGEWYISHKNNDYNNVIANVTYGTTRLNAYQILEQTLNLRDVKIYNTVIDSDGKERRVPNEKETTLAREKQSLIQSKFRDWIFKDYDRRTELVTTYNEKFNSVRPREYDGSHLVFGGMTPEISLRKHQLDAIAHTIYGGNTLLAHEVGAGKSFEMIASAMEAKRLGQCNKSLFVVPNHLTEQMGADVLRLYPSANVLVATSKDFSKDKRRKMCAKIATGDFDIVVIGHSQLEKIPISMERQERFIQKELDEVIDGIADLKSSKAEHFQVKQLERTKKNLEARLKKLTESVKRDDVVTFEELGVDRLYVDEAHCFKNAYFFTKMQNVAGLSQTEAQKASDLMMKCRYIDELTGGRGLTFATGTPVSNSMVEVYTMMKYLQDHTLKEMGWQHFDSWAATFGETVTQNELAPEGKGYRSRTRFARFYNLPELMTAFKECADIKTEDVLNLPTPEAHYHNVVAEPTEMQKAMVDGLSERARKIHEKLVTPDEDNMLCITNDGRKIGLDARLMNPMAEDEPQTKVNLCVDNVFKIWSDTAERRSTQLIFCDFSTPKSDSSFNLYDDIRDKLVSRGVPKEEIVFIHEAKTEPQKKDLFAKLRKGTVRIMIGSTSKCGAGVNVQDKLIALHDLDAPWRPADLQQRSGRIVRQGNENPEVDIFRYVTNGTFDSYLWQTLENKQKFISQIMTSKSPVRSCEDADEATLSYAEVKALCAGDPKIKEKMDLDIEVAKLKVLKASHTNTEYALQDSIHEHFPRKIAEMKGVVERYAKDVAYLETQKPPEGEFAPMTIMGHEYIKKEDAGKALLQACSLMKIGESHNIGKYMGFTMSVKYDSFKNTFYLTLKRNQEYTAELGKDENGNIVRINNALKNATVMLNNSRANLENLEIQLENAKKEVGKPFPQEEELQQKTARLAELERQLALDSSEKQPVEQQDKVIEVDATQPQIKNEPVSMHSGIRIPSVPAYQPTAVYADSIVQKSNVKPHEQPLAKRPSLLGRINIHKAALAQKSGKQPQKERTNEL